MAQEFYSLKVKDFIQTYPYMAEYLQILISKCGTDDCTIKTWLSELTDEDFLEAGMEREQTINFLVSLTNHLKTSQRDNLAIQTVTVLGGKNKLGEQETPEFTAHAGQIYCIVGPTGSGKSRLLADIECMAQGDTPTRRKILINGHEPDSTFRFMINKKPMAQISQNMNFVVDMTVRDFITIHAKSRLVSQVAETVDNIIICANDLTGEKFSPDVSVTQLSGGQSRALMIADTALLSKSPVILIDEIENAGIDRKKALKLLIKKEKMVFISTHDPLLALLGSKRLVIKNGGIVKIIETSPQEQENLKRLEQIDTFMMDIRQRLIMGEIIDKIPYCNIK